MSAKCNCCGRDISPGENLYPGNIYQLSFLGDNDLGWCDHQCYQRDKQSLGLT